MDELDDWCLEIAGLGEFGRRCFEIRELDLRDLRMSFLSEP